MFIRSTKCVKAHAKWHQGPTGLPSVGLVRPCAAACQFASFTVESLSASEGQEHWFTDMKQRIMRDKSGYLFPAYTKKKYKIKVNYIPKIHSGLSRFNCFSLDVRTENMTSAKLRGLKCGHIYFNYIKQRNNMSQLISLHMSRATGRARTFVGCKCFIFHWECSSENVI